MKTAMVSAHFFVVTAITVSFLGCYIGWLLGSWWGRHREQEHRDTRVWRLEMQLNDRKTELKRHQNELECVMIQLQRVSFPPPMPRDMPLCASTSVGALIDVHLHMYQQLQEKENSNE